MVGGIGVVEVDSAIFGIPGEAVVQTSLLEIQRANECVFILNDLRREECANILKLSFGDFLNFRVRFSSVGDIVFLRLASIFGEAQSSLSEKDSSFFTDTPLLGDSLIGAKLSLFLLFANGEFRRLGDANEVSDKRLPTFSEVFFMISLFVCMSSL